MKKLSTLALSLALTASLAAPAFAAEEMKPVLISAPLTYTYTITVNGTELDTAALPMADEGYVPMRLLAESDHGSASWYPDENSSWFYFGDFNYNVNFADNTVTKGEDKLDATVVVKNGVTFLPVSVFDGIEGYTITVVDNKIDVTTPNGTPIVKLGYSVADKIGLHAQRNPANQLESFFGLKAENYTEVASFLPMMNVKSTSLLIGKVAEGKMDAAKAELKTYQDSLLRNFETYLRDQYELAKDGKIVTSGDYILFVISEDNDTAVEMFNAYVAEQK